MTDDDIRRRFAAILPESLPKSRVAQLVSLGRLLEIKSGATASLGETSERFIVFVAEGTAKFIGHIGNDREQIVSFVMPDDLVMFSRTATLPYTLCGITHARLLVFPAGIFIRAVAADGDLANRVFEHLFLGFDRSRDMAVLLGRKTARERVATFLSSMSERIGTRTSGAISIDLPVSRREIADSLGLTIETVSRQFTELRELGVIDTSGRSEVSIRDLQYIRKLAASVD